MNSSIGEAFGTVSVCKARQMALYKANSPALAHLKGQADLFAACKKQMTLAPLNHFCIEQSWSVRPIAGPLLLLQLAQDLAAQTPVQAPTTDILSLYCCRTNMALLAVATKHPMPLPAESPTLFLQTLGKTEIIGHAARLVRLPRQIECR